ncbi:MAG TPA: YihY/virulence factor BrkB family protein [Terriglobales bacterium]|nr:YihY/virulence factor BrkB family protein [Terriglobales bacterium]
MNFGTPAATGVKRASDLPQQPGPSPLERYAEASAQSIYSQAWPTIKYLTRTDVHTFAFSVAANAILSFFPFVVLLLTLSRRVFHSETMFDVIVNLLRDYLPTGQDFIVRNLKAMVSARSHTQVISIFILLFTSTGVFLPLEVALNQVWGFRKNRSYLMNQLIALVLAFACGLLALGSVALTAGNQILLGHVLGENFVTRAVSFSVMKTFAILCSVSIFFLIYWVLPHGKVPAKAVLPAAVVAGAILEIAKFIYILLLPWLNFQEVYGPFAISVTLIFWAFLSGLLLLGGAHLSTAGLHVRGLDAENG